MGNAAIDKSEGEFKYDIFLSHAGEDHAQARAITASILRELNSTRDVRVFNTSEPENRFHEFLRTKPDEPITSQWDRAALRQYLRDNMIASRSYLLLVTPQSLAKRSEWIEFEIATARELAQQRYASFFFPCVYGGATLSRLPEGAFTFQGVELSSQDGVTQLVYALRKTALKDCL